ncbi:epoxide hydrolase N-terminal domain-containing protein [Streptomyces sp. 8L]|uniref:epoxide hydrolase N-terminal domain-containing protein n=1 Tax=Streptomyces sp. 8L TaxID=2877242 RepID=UPI001CD321BE|nr:epoxide hydrolase N-terminal domain-containing protein [Streptomyces sp. 8L]
MDWEDGTDLAFLQRLTDYRQNRLDRRTREAQLNTLPQFTADVDETDIHFIHQRGTGSNPYPLVLTHGCTSTSSPAPSAHPWAKENHR